jgi:hypothetical protein
MDLPPFPQAPEEKDPRFIEPTWRIVVRGLGFMILILVIAFVSAFVIGVLLGVLLGVLRLIWDFCWR